MKPERTHRGGRFALAAARTALRAELGWLRGHPLGAPRGGALPWRVVPHPVTRAAPEDQVVDRERLRAAAHALATLPRRFPRALPRVVGDVRAWVERAQALLRDLSAAVHEGRPLPALTARDGDGAPLVEALTWTHALDPERRERALHLARALAPVLEVVTRRDAGPLALQLVDLVLDDPRGPGLPALELLGREALWTTPLTADPGELERLAVALDHPSPAPRWRPPARSAPLGATALALVRGALAQDAGARDRALGVLVAVLPLELVERWAAWWGETDARTARVRRRVIGAERCCACVRTEGDALRELGRRRPPSVRPSALRVAVGAGVDLAPDAADRLVEVLGAVDPLASRSWREPARLQLASVVGSEPRRAAAALDALARVARDLPGALGGHAPTIAGWLLDRGRTLERPDRARALTRALVDLARDGRLEGLDHARWVMLTEHVDRTGDARAATALVRAADGLEVPWPLERTLAALCAGDPGKVARVVRGLGKDEWGAGQAQALADLASRDDLRPLLVEALGGGEGWRVRRLAVQASLVRGLLGPGALRDVPAPAGPTEVAAADPARWRQELGALERLAPSAPLPRAAWMRARAARLRARLAGDEVVAPRRARAAERRRARRTLREGLVAWTRALEACGARALAAWVGQPLPAAWLDCPRRLRVLAGLADLQERPLRDLAARVLRARLGPPPWDLRDAPANAAFVERLRARGLDPAPWLDSTDARAWTAQGRALTLRLEDDPLEVLRMGEPFRTCLAPGESNFFAALVDAADVNKRVLYARAADGGAPEQDASGPRGADAESPEGRPMVAAGPASGLRRTHHTDGAIVGRCLLALTAEGAIVTYHPYCHDARLGFADQVRAFVQDLARAMGTRVVSSGEVPRLLGPDWYCDAPEDVVGVTAALEGALRPALRAAAPEDVPRLVEAALGRAPDQDALERVLDLPELDERPELALGLAPLALALRPRARSRVRLIERLVRVGAHEPARALARGVRVDQLDALDAATLARALLTLGRAHAAHDALRRSAPRGPELVPERHEAWALVCEALHRVAAAREHWARGAEGRYPSAARERCRARLASLDGRARAG